MKDALLYRQRTHSLGLIQAASVVSMARAAHGRQCQVRIRAGAGFDYTSVVGMSARLYFSPTTRKPRIVSGHVIAAEPNAAEGEYLFQFVALRDEEFRRVQFAADGQRSNIHRVELIFRNGSRRIDNPLFQG